MRIFDDLSENNMLSHPGGSEINIDKNSHLRSFDFSSPWVKSFQKPQK